MPAPQQSLFAELDPRVHYVDHGGPPGGPLLVCVHGLGGSLLNWVSLAPLLTPVCRVVAVDLLGFGRSEAVGLDTSVAANQRMLRRFLTEVAGEPAVLVGNSMGGLVAALTAAEHPQLVPGVALLDPVLPWPPGARPDPLVGLGFAAYAVPRLGPLVVAGRRRVRTPEQLAWDLLRLCCADPTRVADDVVALHVALMRDRRSFPDLDRQFLDAARSVLAVLRDPARYVAALRGIPVPVLLVHGDRDRLMPVEAARAAARANPGWTYVEAAGVGHVPQLEVPEWTAGQVLRWLDVAVPRVGRAERDGGRGDGDPAVPATGSPSPSPSPSRRAALPP